VVEAAIARAEEAHDLGGVVDPCYERARVNGASPDRAPWFGMPTFVKDLGWVAEVTPALSALRAGRRGGVQDVETGLGLIWAQASYNTLLTQTASVAHCPHRVPRRAT
jgi:hypothetical protein